MSETTKSREFSDGLEHFGGGEILSWKLHGSAMQIPGLPDHIYCFDTKMFGTGSNTINFVGVESKIMDYSEIPQCGVDLRTLPSAIQQVRLKHINAAGGLGLVCLFVTHKRKVWAVFANVDEYDAMGDTARMLLQEHLDVKNVSVWVKNRLVIAKRAVKLHYYDYEYLWDTIADYWGPVKREY